LSHAQSTYGQSFETELRDYCHSLFGTLPRADQRRSGEAYVRGLLGGHGRKSIRRIAIQHVGGYSDQSLQQFVNQSPWDPQPVRQRLARLVADELGPTGWVLEESVFLKHGRHSAAVERQFVPSRGRVCNCQLGVSVLLANEHMSVPVHWMLAIPLSWDRDESRRYRARIPPEVRSRPYWQYQIEALDDMSGDWGIPPAPAIIDARSTAGLHDLLAELDSRCMDYLVEVSGNVSAQWRCGPQRVPHPATPGGGGGHGGPHAGTHPASCAGSCTALPGQPGQGAAEPAGADGQAGVGHGGPPRYGTLTELARTVPQPERRLVAWQEPLRGRTMRAQFSALPTVSVAGAGRRGGAGPQARAPRLLLVEWPLGKSEPRGFWITNMVDRPVPELTALAKLRLRARHDLETLTDQFGLCDYEGRSFLGWHHHVTLASMAYAFDTLHRRAASLEVQHAVGN
jgi:DDE superfamily endonuclease